MARRPLDLVIRTPSELALRARALSVRVPTESGQVGLRAGAEAVVLSIEAGIILARTEEKVIFVGTAGGLLRSNGKEVTVVTPLAIVGERAETILSELHQKLGEPSSELQARATLGKLEERILEELHREGDGRAGRSGLP